MTAPLDEPDAIVARKVKAGNSTRISCVEMHGYRSVNESVAKNKKAYCASGAISAQGKFTCDHNCGTCVTTTGGITLTSSVHFHPCPTRHPDRHTKNARQHIAPRASGSLFGPA